MATRQRQHWAPNAETARLLEAVREVIYDDEHRDFWPLTLRGVHYAMLGIEGYANTPQDYKRLGALLTKARLSGRIPWDAIADNHREMMTAGGFSDADDFISFSQRDFLTGYNRHLTRSQDVVLELWVEKDTIARYVHDVASEYCLSTVVARGYGSVSFVNDLRDRIGENVENGKKTRILYFGDLDPSGVNMLTAMFLTLHEEMDVDPVDADYERCAINEEHVRRFRLPPNPDALKDDAWQANQRRLGNTDKTKGDPRAEAYKAEYGKVAVELDALGPRRLQDLVRKAIERNLDMDLFRQEQALEVADRKRINRMRARVEDLLTEE